MLELLANLDFRQSAFRDVLGHSDEAYRLARRIKVDSTSTLDITQLTILAKNPKCQFTWLSTSPYSLYPLNCRRVIRTINQIQKSFAGMWDLLRRDIEQAIHFV
jgi:hypothetical protein